MPKISVITPVYNAAPYLPRCIDSILAQTFRDFELILVDDGSTDTSGHICDQYARKDSRIRVIHQKNQGQAAARNHALDLIQGEYIAFVDSDDWIAPEFLSVLYGNIRTYHADIAVCGHQRTREYEIPRCQDISSPPVPYTGRDFLLHCMAGRIGKHWLLWDKLFHRSCFRDIRLPAGRIFEDNATVYRLLYNAKTLVDCGIPLYYYFQREGSTVHTRSWKKTSDYLLMWEEMCQYFAQRQDIPLLDLAEKSYFAALVDCCPRAPAPDLPRDALPEVRKKLKAQKKKLEATLPITVKTCPAYYEALYPRRMYLYWTLRGILSKWKR